MKKDMSLIEYIIYLEELVENLFNHAMVDLELNKFENQEKTTIKKIEGNVNKIIKKYQAELIMKYKVFKKEKNHIRNSIFNLLN